MSELLAFISENAAPLFAAWILVSLVVGICIGRAIKFGNGDWYEEEMTQEEKTEWLEARR